VAESTSATHTTRLSMPLIGNLLPGKASKRALSEV
jgi:hypothetical protein